jgi:hypothetical protein
MPSTKNTIEGIMEDLKSTARDSWSGETGEERARNLESFLNETLENYSKVLGFTKLEILMAIEGRRDYSEINYYQRANFPLLENVTVFADKEEYREKCPSGKFTCPHCGGVSTDPQDCNSGRKIREARKIKVCNWKSYGFFRTMGRGYQLVIKDTFLKDGIVHHIFKPIEIE